MLQHTTEIVFKLLTTLKVWKVVSGAFDFLEDNPSFFTDMLKLVFGPKVPTRIRNVPSFGGVISPSDHFLSLDGFNIFFALSHINFHII
jgi:hypothetical protein